MNLLKMFTDAPDIKEFSAGETILEEGISGDVMYVVMEGKVDIRVNEFSIEKVVPGEIVGEMALIDSRARSANVVALTRCRLAPVTEKQFLFMVQRTPLFSLHVMRVLADRIRKINEKL